ncbi:MAG: DivIVA domain-containing protein, partial [Acidimicrobiia bacterium]
MSDGPLSPEEVAHRGFSTAFRGFDTGEVRAYLQRVANELRESTGRERELNRRLADAEHRAAHPVIEGDALTRLLGEEMARILATAQEAAGELRAKAEDNAARILRDAHDQAQRIRAKAEVVLAERSEEADGQAAEIRRVAAAEAAEVRRVAAAEAASVVDRARLEAADVVAGAEARAREAVEEAQAVRGRVLGDLTRRRRLLQMQVETLRAGRERLLDAYRLVRRSVDEVADELQRAENEARQAATAAGERAGAELDAGELDAGALDAGALDAGDEGDGPTAAAEASPPAGPPPPTPAEAPGSPAEGDAGAGHRPPQLRLVSSPGTDAGADADEGADAGGGSAGRTGGEEVRVIATRPGAAASSARRPAAGAPEGAEAPGRGEARRPAAGAA